MFKTNKTPAIQEKTASGAVATFNTILAGLPLKSHKIALTATQSGSGTPSPVNVRTINGYSNIGISATGVNLWGGNALLQSFIDFRSTITYTDDYLEFAAGWFSSYPEFTPTKIFKANTQYTFIITANKLTGAGSNINLRIDYTDSTYTRIYFNAPIDQKQTLVVVSSENKTIRALVGENAGGATTLYYNECGVFEGVHTIDDFEPFGTYTTIQIGSTVYGGTYNAITGILTVTHGIDTIDNSWSIYSDYIYKTISDIFQAPLGDTTHPILIENIEYGGVSQYVGSITQQTLGQIANGGLLILRDNTCSTKTDFIDKYGGGKFVYYLATPTTIQLPPCPIDTLEGVNNIWADTGDTSLSYNDLNIAKRGSFREVFKIPTY